VLAKPLAAYTHLSSTVSHLFKPQMQKKSAFSCTAAHIFVSPGDAPAIITQYVAWMERQFNACQTHRSMYLSIFNSFRVIQCLSQCVSPKIAFFTYCSPYFRFPWKRPWGNHAKFGTDGKRIRCLQIALQHVPIYLQQFPSYLNRNCKQEAQLSQRGRAMPRVVEYFR